MCDFFIPKLRCICLEKKSINRYNHIACLARGKKIIHIAQNDYNRQLSDGKVITSLHAEINCVKKYKNNLKNLKLIILRFTSDGRLCESRPCSACKNYLISRGLSRIYCSTESGSIEKFKPEDIIEYHSPAQIKLYEQLTKKILYKQPTVYKQPKQTTYK
jgi:deoxycytidylate deaminase